VAIYPIEHAKLVPELYCSSIRESLRFYIGVLGFRIIYERPEEGFALLDRNGAQLMLEQPSDPSRSLVTADLSHPFGRGVNFQVSVEDVDALYNEVVRSGLLIIWPLEEHEYRRGEGSVTVRQFVIADPDGYLLRLSQIVGERSH
jgi:lactoylglutathione lyase